MPEGDAVVHVKTHGVDEIALKERWASPRDVGWLWAGANVEMETFMYGTIAGRLVELAPQSCVAGRYVHAAAWARRSTNAGRRDIRCGRTSV